MFGGFASNMQDANERVSNITYNVADLYNKWDYGLIAGYAYPIRITGNLTLTPGIIARYGRKNVFSGTSKIPDYLNKTQTASINISFSLGYSLF